MALCTFIEVGQSLWQYLLYANFDLINCHFSLSQSLLLLLYLFDNPVFLLKKGHFVEKHVFAFLRLHEHIVKYLSVSKYIFIIENYLHFIDKHLVLNFLIEESSDCLPNLLQLEAFFQLNFDLLAKLLLCTFLYVKIIDSLE